MAGDSSSNLANEKLIFALQNDLKSLALDAKKKHGPVKDACEEAIAKIRTAQSTSDYMVFVTKQALFAIVQGCETKDSKIVKVSGIIDNLIDFCVAKVLLSY